MTYVCIICGHHGPRADGRPVDDTRYPSWRCADTVACAARFLARESPEAGPTCKRGNAAARVTPDQQGPASVTSYEPRHARG